MALGGQVFWALAFYELQASEVSFLARVTMFFAIIGSMILFRDERLLLKRPGFHLGVALIVGGFIAFALAKVQHTSVIQTPGNRYLGVAYVLACAAFFGGYMVSVRSCIPTVNPLLAFGVVANLVSMGTILGMFWMGDVTSISRQTPFSWLLLISASLLGIAVGHIMLFTAVQRLGAAITSACQTMMPFVTATAAYLLLSESLSLGQWIGGCIIVAGAILLLSLKHRIAETPEESKTS